MFARKVTTALSAVGMGLAPQIAAAQDCITQQEVEATAIYAMPALLDSASSACADALPADSFLLSESTAMRADYDQARAAYWPDASRAVMKMVASKDGSGMEDMSILTQLPEQAVRPMIDALIMQELVSEIPAEDCVAVNRVARALAPLDPDELGGVFGALFITIMSEDDETMFCAEA